MQKPQRSEASRRWQHRSPESCRWFAKASALSPRGEPHSRDSEIGEVGKKRRQRNYEGLCERSAAGNRGRDRGENRGETKLHTHPGVWSVAAKQTSSVARLRGTQIQLPVAAFPLKRRTLAPTRHYNHRIMGMNVFLCFGRLSGNSFPTARKSFLGPSGRSVFLLVPPARPEAKPARGEL